MPPSKRTTKKVASKRVTKRSRTTTRSRSTTSSRTSADRRFADIDRAIRDQEAANSRQRAWSADVDAWGSSAQDDLETLMSSSRIAAESRAALRDDLTDLDGRFTRHSTGQMVVNRRLNEEQQDIRRELERRVVTSENSGTPGYVWLISLVAGIGAWLAWLSIGFTTLVNVNKTTRFRFVYEYADSWWCAIIVGMAAFALVWALLPRFARRSEVIETEEQDETAQVPPMASPPEETPPEVTAEMPVATVGQS